jgi:hypothetical protein
MRRLSIAISHWLRWPAARSVVAFCQCGPNTYIVTEHMAPTRTGSAEAQRIAPTEANAWCAQ